MDRQLYEELVTWFAMRHRDGCFGSEFFQGERELGIDVSRVDQIFRDNDMHDSVLVKELLAANDQVKALFYRTLMTLGGVQKLVSL